MMFSLWDAYPHHVAGRWLEVGTPEWTTELETVARCAISELGARGARIQVVLAPNVIEQPQRGADKLDAAYQNVAAADPARVGLIDDRGAIEAGGTSHPSDGIPQHPHRAQVRRQAALRGTA